MTTEYTAMPRKDEYCMMWHPKITLPDRYGSIPRLIQSGGQSTAAGTGIQSERDPLCHQLESDAITPNP